MLAALQNVTLKPAPYTVVTGLTGSKTLYKPDGSATKLADDARDEDGAWGVMDEMASTGVDDPLCGADPAPWEAFEGDAEGGATLHALVAKEPALKEFVHMLQADGVPLNVVKSRITGALGKTLATSFVNAVNAEGEGAGEDERTGPAASSGSGSGPAVMHGSHAEQHGRLGQPDWVAPRLATRCGEIARPGYNSGRAHEYMDEPEVLRAKVKVLADLFRAAKKPVIYAGAGLSTAAGINDYATRAGAKSQTCLAKGVNNVAQVGGAAAANDDAAMQRGLCGANKVLSPFCAKPSAGHHVIAALAREGLVWRFVQQNHDGLPQKAGVPQACMNEIHGGWFDPSNPVVKMSGNLRGDLFEDLLTCEAEADLVLAIGTSLSGMNADRLVSTCAAKARKGHSSTRKALGSVIVSLQRTPHDENSSLRIYALIDDVMRLLAQELGLEVGNDPASLGTSKTAVYQPHHLIQRMIGGAKKVDVDVFEVPYDPANGQRVDGAAATTHVLDLREGKQVMITDGPQKGEMATVLGRNADGHWRVRVTHRQVSNSGAVKEFGEIRLLGAWWPVAAMAGEVASIPVVTVPAVDAA